MTYFRDYMELFSKCVFYCPMNGNYQDYAKYHSITAYGNPTFVNTTSERKVLSLNNANLQYLTTPYATASDLLFGTNNFTICMWYNTPNPTNGKNYLLDGRTAAGYLTPISIYLSADSSYLGKVILDISSGGSDWLVYGYSNTALTANTWTLLIVTRNSSTFGYYLNCKSDMTMSTTSATALYGSNTNLYIGSVAGTDSATGMFGPIGIWIGRCLSVDEMRLFRQLTHPVMGLHIYPKTSGVKL